ncbi:MAG TPA: hypothetical protein VK444_05695 [Methanobacteriaceae archaeon]|nr:hypothetical protein [Methanobacteriaceae archaeon]
MKIIPEDKREIYNYILLFIVLVLLTVGVVILNIFRHNGFYWP